MKALVLNNKVCQVSADEFPVAYPLQWVDCSDDVMPDWCYDGNFTKPQAIVVVKSNSELLSETDVWMSRISEDTVVALINKGIASKADYAPIVLERINYRRSLRNQAPI